MIGGLSAAWRLVLAALLLHAGAACAAVLEIKSARAEIVAEGREPVLRQVTLPYHLDRDNGTLPSRAVFELHFPLDQVPTETYGVYLPRVGNTGRIHLNGTLLVRLGDMDEPNGDDYSKAPVYLSIPPKLLAHANLLVVELRNDSGRRGGLSSVFVGPAGEVRPLFQNDWRWRMTGSLVVAIVSLLVGSVALALWLTQGGPGLHAMGRRDPLYLAAAVAEYCWALRVGDIAIDQPPLPWPLWGVLLTAAFAGWICCIAVFCHQVAGWNRHPRAGWFRAWLLALFFASVAASAAAFTLHKPVLLTAWLGCANLFFIGYAAWYLRGAVRSGSRTWLLVAMAGIANVAMGVRDWVAIRISGGYDTNTWIRYSSVLFGLVLAYIVITRFREASAQARDLMTNLAARVAEKEEALKRSYEQLERLAQDEARSSERARILRDMHDGVGSHISAAIRQLQSGRASSEDVLLTLRDSLDQLKLSIDSMNLPPGDITALLANLRYRLAPRFAASDIELGWDVDLLPPLPGLDSAAMRQLQFIVFEALSNVLQHARARRLRIEAKADGEGGAVLRIADDGAGFDTSQPGGQGRRAMQERAGAIGARLSVASGPGGTTVELALRG